jgi:hypothetical protein
MMMLMMMMMMVVVLLLLLVMMMMSMQMTSTECSTCSRCYSDALPFHDVAARCVVQQHELQHLRRQRW